MFNALHTTTATRVLRSFWARAATVAVIAFGAVAVFSAAAQAGTVSPPYVHQGLFTKFIYAKYSACEAASVGLDQYWGGTWHRVASSSKKGGNCDDTIALVACTGSQTLYRFRTYWTSNGYAGYSGVRELTC